MFAVPLHPTGKDLHMLRPTAAKLIITAVALLACASCSDSTTPLEPSVISVTGGTGSLSFVGESTQLSATVTDQHGAQMPDVQVNWATSDGSIATVSGSGTVTAVRNGTAQITASAGSANGSRSIRVELVPETIEQIAGDGQEGTVAQNLPDSLRIRVLDSGGAPIPGAAVQTQVGGDGLLSPGAGETRSDGSFAAEWTLPTEAGGEREAVLQSGTVQFVFRATAHPGTPSSGRILDGNEQDGWAGDPLDTELILRVEDDFGNGVPSHAVEWTVASGHGSVVPLASTTDSTGQARAEWTVGESLGVGRTIAAPAGLPSVEFAANVHPNGVIHGRVSSTGAWLSPPLDILATDGGPSGTQQSYETSSGVATTRNNAESPTLIDDELLVRLHDNPSAFGRMGLGSDGTPRSIPEAEALAESMSARLSPPAAMGGSPGWEIVDVSPVLRVARVRVDPGMDRETIARALREHPEVASVEPHEMVSLIEPIQAPSVQNPFDLNIEMPSAANVIDDTAPAPFQPSADPFWPIQAWHYKRIGAWESWRVTRGDPSVIVAVVDDGIRTDHPELTGNLTEGYSFVGSDPIPRCSGGTVPRDGHGMGPGPDPNTPKQYIRHPSGCVSGERDIGGHGLHVAGTIGAIADNGIGVSGVAPGVRIMPVRVLDSAGSGSILDIADGILYAAGFPVSDRHGGYVQAGRRAQIINLSLGSSSFSSIAASAVRQAHQEGLLIVGAAGNDGAGQVSYPAALPEVIAVSSFGPDESIAPYSNWGPEIELAGPGGDRGTWGFFGGVCSTSWHFADNRSALTCSQGTSMAAPHVAGVAALVWSRYSELSHEEIRRILRETANPRGGAVPNQGFGHGMVNARSAVWGGGGIPGTTYVSLYDDSGARVGTTAVSQDGTYEFRRLAPSDYRVFAGRDRYNEGRIGIPLRQWSAHGGTGSPTVITTANSGSWKADIQMGYPTQTHQNRSAAAADWLPIGGYMLGHLSSSDDVAWFEVRVPESGSFVFQTRGILGVCGLTRFADTLLELRTPTGVLIASHESEAPPYNLCSRIETQLDPGTYHLRVRAANGHPGFFGILAGRSGG